MTIAQQSRREFLATSGAGCIALAVASALAPLSASAQRQTQILNRREQRTLEAVADTLLPGAADAGIVAYLQAQLNSPQPLLMLRYLDFATDYAAFYRDGLQAVDAYARLRLAARFDRLPTEQQTELIRELSASQPDRWTGPPAPLLIFALRSDAVDVFYGTRAGFDRLNIPYLPHILPESDW